MKIVKNLFSVLLLFTIIFSYSFPMNLSAEEDDNTLQYVALGNSLAAGYLNDKTLGNGYPVYISEGIEQQTEYSVNLINEGVGGYTTVDVLTQLEENHNNVLESIANADILTIDAGANDVLQAVDFENLDINEAIAVINQVKTNLTIILDKVFENNEDIQVYVMGYYNALPHEEDQSLINTAINILNNAIKGAAENSGAIYISTFEAFEGHYDEFLPEPDIHPTEAGYQVIAEQFLQQIIPNLPPIDKGQTWFTGEGIPNNELGEMGDFYLDITTYDVYEKSEDGWTIVGNLKGSDGIDGEDGQDGEPGEDGTDGEDGKPGENGKPGATWLVGEGVPNEDAGTIGDSYFDTLTGDVYVKTENDWIFSVNIKGPQGESGENGSKEEKEEDDVQDDPEVNDEQVGKEESNQTDKTNEKTSEQVNSNSQEKSKQVKASNSKENLEEDRNIVAMESNDTNKQENTTTVKQRNKLPDTDANTFNIILLGTITLMLGIMLMVLRKRIRSV